MPFKPAVNSQIILNGIAYTFPQFPGVQMVIPYGQTGKRATVYQITDVRGSLFALKVFFSVYRRPQIEHSAAKLKVFAQLPGLQVCSRAVLNRQNHPALLQQFPDLEYAVLMPWVDGKTWFDIVSSRESFTLEKSWYYARSLANMFIAMEEKGIAHCDISSANVFLETSQPGNVALVDVEEMFAPGFEKPDPLPAGSDGYGHKTAASGLWSADADRFSGAVLLAEVLAWADPRIRSLFADAHYFEKVDLQTDCPRYWALMEVLPPQVGELFRRAWFSSTLNDCPAFAQWCHVLFDGQPQVSPEQELSSPPLADSASPVLRWRNISSGSNPSVRETETPLTTVLKTAETLVYQGNIPGALEILKQAREIASPSDLAAVNQRISALTAQQSYPAPPVSASANPRSFFQSEAFSNTARLEKECNEAIQLYNARHFDQAESIFRQIHSQKPEFSLYGRSIADWLNLCEREKARAKTSIYWIIGGVIAGLFLCFAVFGIFGTAWLNSPRTAPQPADIQPAEIPTNKLIPPTARPSSTVAQRVVPTNTRVPPTTRPANTSQPTRARISNEIYFVALRKSPGYSNKNDSIDILAEVPAGDMVQILDGPKRTDGLNWWYVSWNGTTGWMADHTSSGKTTLIFE